jgi:hypothetical protein
MRPEHPLDMLPEYVAGRLDPDRAAVVRRHLDLCVECKLQLAGWREVAAAARDVYSPAAVALPEGLMRRVVEAVAQASESGEKRRPLRSRLAWLGQLIAAQAPLARREIWPASTVVMAIGAAVSLIAGHGGGASPGTALALLAPLAAALGIAMIYGQENDPALELALATPTSPRLVLVARLAVVLTWDLILAGAATVALAVVNGPAIFLPLVSLWLGPMLLLSCLTLLLSLFISTSLAIVAAAMIWIVRALEVAGPSRAIDLGGLTSMADAIWQTSPLGLIAALCLLVAAVALVPYREPLTARPGI